MNNPDSCDVIPQLRFAIESGKLYKFLCENLSTTSSTPMRMKKIGIERTMGFKFIAAKLLQFPPCSKFKVHPDKDHDKVGAPP
jgi:hypothetical protein